MTRKGDKYFNLDIEDFETLEDLKEIWRNLDLFPSVSFKDYLDFTLYHINDEELTEEVSSLYRDIDPKEYKDERFWEEKIEEYMEKDNDILNKIYLRQFQLLTNTIHPSVENASYRTKTRTLSYDVYELSNSITTSIYDKFIFKNPSKKIPFIKLYNYGLEENYKIYNKSSRKEISEWDNIDDNIDKSIPFKDNNPFIFFLFKWEESSKTDYSKCYLSEDKLYINVASTYPIETIDSYFKEQLKDFLDIEIENYFEESVEIEATLKDFEYIDLPIFQYYLISDGNPPFYINEKTGVVSYDTRKIRMYNNSFLPRNEPFIIEYDKSSARTYMITGSREEEAINYFREIFGRYIHGFFLRQHALRVILTKLVESSDGISSFIKVDKSKQKKATFTKDPPHTITFKKKIDYIKSFIDVDKLYSKSAQCPNQPIVLTKEEADAWLKVKRTIFSNSKNYVTKDVKSFTNRKGNKLYFACPNDNLPVIHFIREGSGKDEVYEFSPRCLSKKRTHKDEEIQVYEKGDENLGDIKSIKSFDENNIDDDELPNPSIKHRSYLNLELKHILSHLLEINYKNLKLIYPYSKTTNHMMLSVIAPLFEKGKISIQEMRNKIADNTDPMLVSQEALGKEISPEKLVKDFRNMETLINSNIHLRMFEEYFDIHIFVFTLKANDSKKKKKVWEMSREIDMEIPLNKVFHARSLKKDRKCVILLKTLESQDYAVISDRTDNSVFGPEITSRMMDMFYEMSKYTVSKGKDIYTNLYSKYYWQDLIPGDPITAQEIDIAGKCRIIQTQSGLTIQIPPTDPFNVPLIEKYEKIEYEKVEKIFGIPMMEDGKSVYYPYHGIPNMISVLCENITFRSDFIYEIPMSIYQDEERIDIEISLYRQLKRATYALIQIIQWAWSVSSRPKFKEWFDDFITIVPKPESPYDNLPEQIFTYLPEVENPREGFVVISKWWPEMFSRTGRIKLWNSLYENILIFFENEERVIGGYLRIKEKPIPNLIGFYETPEDYNTPDEVRVFHSKSDFDKWHRLDRIREDSSVLGVIDFSNFEDIRNIMEKKNYFRVKFKNHFMIVRNFENNEKEEVIEKALEILEIPKNSDNFGINVYAFSKNYEIVLKEGTYENVQINLLMYPNDTYAFVQF